MFSLSMLLVYFSYASSGYFSILTLCIMTGQVLLCATVLRQITPIQLCYLSISFFPAELSM